MKKEIVVKFFVVFFLLNVAMSAWAGLPFGHHHHPTIYNPEYNMEKCVECFAECKSSLQEQFGDQLTSTDVFLRCNLGACEKYCVIGKSSIENVDNP